LRSPYLDINPKLAKIKEEYPSDLPKLQSGALFTFAMRNLVEHSYGLSYIQLGREEDVLAL